MARTKINVDSILNAKKNASSAERTVSDARYDVNNIRNNLYYKVLWKYNISGRLSQASRDLSDVESRIERIMNAVSNGANLYSSTDAKVDRMARDMGNGRISSSGTGGLGGNIIGGFKDLDDAVSKIKNIIAEAGNGPHADLLKSILEMYNKKLSWRSELKTDPKKAFSIAFIQELLNQKKNDEKVESALWKGEYGEFSLGFLSTVFEKTSDKVTKELSVIQGTAGDFVLDILNMEHIKSDDVESVDASLVKGSYGDYTLKFLNQFFEKAGDKNTVAASILKLSGEEFTAGLLNYMMQSDGKKLSESASVFNVQSGNDWSLDLLGAQYETELGKIFGTTSAGVFAAQFTNGNTKHSFLSAGVEGKSSLTSSGPIVLFSKDKDKKGVDKLKDGKSAADTAEDWLEKKELRREYDEDDDPRLGEKYFDKDGNQIDKPKDVDFYDKKATVLEGKAEANASVNLYSNETNWGKEGGLASAKGGITVGEAEAHASIAAGLYVVGTDGKQIFSPGINAECGASVTVFEAELEGKFGTDMLGVNGDVGLTLGKAEAKADIGAQLIGEDGKLDVQFGASASAEAIAAEAEASVGVNVLGGEIGVTGGVNFGIGAHADVGYRDGVFKLDVGASLGVGVSLDVEVDVGGMIDTAADALSDAADAVSDAAEKTVDAVCDGAKAVWDFVSFWD